KLQRHEPVAHPHTAAQELLTLKVPEHAAIIPCVEQSATVVADEVAIRYAGRIVAYWSARDVLPQLAHSYTQGLMHTMVHRGMQGRQLVPIPGQPPDLTRRLGGVGVPRAARRGNHAAG